MRGIGGTAELYCSRGCSNGYETQSPGGPEGRSDSPKESNDDTAAYRAAAPSYRFDMAHDHDALRVPQAPRWRAVFSGSSALPNSRRRQEVSMTPQPSDPDEPDLTSAPTSASASGSDTSSGFGPYRFLQRLGEGGMGEVWLAEQLRPVRRQVAIKVVKAGMDTAQVVARFEAERQALAVMDHPAIAKIFDGGTTPEGRPYFAMEYVRGEAITSYCDRQRLPIQRAPRAVHPALRRRPACAPEGHHSPRPEAVQCAGLGR